MRWLNVQQGNAEHTTATIAVIQLGTLAAVFVYFASDIRKIIRSFIGDHFARFSGNTKGPVREWMSSETRLGWFVIIGSVPIGTVGLALKDFIEGDATKNLYTIAGMLIAVAVLLAIAEKVGSRRKEIDQLGLMDAVAVGFAQVLALMPGASRAGSTLMGGLFMGQTRETAARFSFLLSIPAITASGLLELREALHIIPGSDYLPLFVGVLFSGIVGYLSIWFLINFLKKHSTGVFIGYRIILGVAILAALQIGLIAQ